MVKPLSKLFTLIRSVQIFKVVYEVRLMKALTSVNRALQYLWEGAFRIFTPDRDEVPAIGVQPYSGEGHTKRAEEYSR